MELSITKVKEIMEAAHPQIDFTSLLQFHDSVFQFQNLVKEKEMTDAQDHWPFHPERLKRFIDAKQSEMGLFCKIVSLDGVVFITENDELKEESAKSRYALVLYIPPLEEWSEIISSTMVNYLRDPFPKSTKHDEVAWHTIEAKRNLLLSKLDQFENHARINQDVENLQFVITYKVHLKSSGCTYTTYEKKRPSLQESAARTARPSDRPAGQNTRSGQFRPHVSYRLEFFHTLPCRQVHRSMPTRKRIREMEERYGDAFFSLEIGKMIWRLEWLSTLPSAKVNSAKSCH